MASTPNERMELAKKFANDVTRMRRCLQASYRQVDDDQIVYAWLDYSESLCTAWIGLPDTNETLLEILLKHLPSSSIHWELIACDAGDGSGDCILPLPDALLSQLGWKVGDTLNMTLDERGNLLAQQKT